MDLKLRFEIGRHLLKRCNYSRIRIGLVLPPNGYCCAQYMQYNTMHIGSKFDATMFIYVYAISALDEVKSKSTNT